MARSRPVRVFSVAYFGVGNLGDETILTAIEASLAGTDAEIDRFAVRRDGFYSDRRAVRLSVRGFFRYIGALLRADRVVLGGGGILKDEGFRILLDLLFTALSARLLRKPVALLAVGVGPLRTKTGSVLVRSIASLCTIRTVRDVESAELLAELGVGNVEVVPDPVFALTPEEMPTDDREGVLISMRPWFFEEGQEMTRRREALVSEGAEALGQILAQGQAGRFVPLYWPRDRDFSVELLAAMDVRGASEVNDEMVGWPELLSLASQSKTAVAMRFHAVIACLMTGTPVVAISYEPKVEALAEAFGVPHVAPGSNDFGARLVELHEAIRDVAPGTQVPRDVLLRSRLAARQAIRMVAGVRKTGQESGTPLDGNRLLAAAGTAKPEIGVATR